MSETTPSSTSAPKSQLVFSPLAYAKFLFWRDATKSEIGGFGISKTDNPLLVLDFVPIEQNGSLAHINFQGEDMNAHMLRMHAERGLDPDECTRIWLHTHPGSSVTPSTQDEDTFAKNYATANWAIMGILGRGGEFYGRLKIQMPGTSLYVTRELTLAVDYTSILDAKKEAAEFKRLYRETKDTPTYHKRNDGQLLIGATNVPNDQRTRVLRGNITRAESGDVIQPAPDLHIGFYRTENWGRTERHLIFVSLDNQVVYYPIPADIKPVGFVQTLLTQVKVRPLSEIIAAVKKKFGGLRGAVATTLLSEGMRNNPRSDIDCRIPQWLKDEHLFTMWDEHNWYLASGQTIEFVLERATGTPDREVYYQSEIIASNFLTMIEENLVEEMKDKLSDQANEVDIIDDDDDFNKGILPLVGE